MRVPKRWQELVSHAPPGFKTAYVEAARDPVEPDVLRGILGLVGFEADVSTIERWSLLQRVSAEVWACNAHGRASDNILRKCPQPEWLPAPWAGRDMSPTSIDERTKVALPS
jgi:hypothetical protein